jgi:hypothetical protein
VREALISHLRDLELRARRECIERDVIHVVASGRNVLGDRHEDHLGEHGNPIDIHRIDRAEGWVAARSIAGKTANSAGITAIAAVR